MDRERKCGQRKLENRQKWPERRVIDKMVIDVKRVIDVKNGQTVKGHS